MVTRPLPGIRLQIYVAPSGDALSAGLEREYLAMMPPAIQAAILGYQRRRDRQATLFGKLLLLRALGMQFPEKGKPSLQSLEAGPHGKPFLPGGPEFNISHSGELVVLAVSQSGPVGIDIEKIRTLPMKDFSRLLPEAAFLLEKQDAASMARCFFDGWTQREAVLKGYGKGLLSPMEQVAIKGAEAHFAGTPWFTKPLWLDEGYCCHIATERPCETPAVEWVDLRNGFF